MSDGYSGMERNIAVPTAKIPGADAPVLVRADAEPLDVAAAMLGWLADHLGVSQEQMASAYLLAGLCRNPSFVEKRGSFEEKSDSGLAEEPHSYGPALVRTDWRGMTVEVDGACEHPHVGEASPSPISVAPKQAEADPKPFRSTPTHDLCGYEWRVEKRHLPTTIHRCRLPKGHDPPHTEHA